MTPSVGRCASPESSTGASAAAKAARYIHEALPLRGGRAAKHSDWHAVRAVPNASSNPAARLRAWRVAGVTIWHERSARASGQFVKRASEEDGVHAQREGRREPAVPEHGKGRHRSVTDAAGLTVQRDGGKPVSAETTARVRAAPGGSTRSVTARRRARDAPGGVVWDNRHPISPPLQQNAAQSIGTIALQGWVAANQILISDEAQQAHSVSH